MKKGPLVASILFGSLLVAASVLLGDTTPPIVENVTMEGANQIVEIHAKGGYSPKVTTAKAGVPTVLRVKTDGTYDCSAALSIPSLGYNKVLEPVGVTEITVPVQESGSTLQGLCSMGMYNFSVKFL